MQNRAWRASSRHRSVASCIVKFYFDDIVPASIRDVYAQCHINRNWFQRMIFGFTRFLSIFAEVMLGPVVYAESCLEGIVPSSFRCFVCREV